MIITAPSVRTEAILKTVFPIFILSSRIAFRSNCVTAVRMQRFGRKHLFPHFTNWIISAGSLAHSDFSYTKYPMGREVRPDCFVILFRNGEKATTRARGRGLICCGDGFDYESFRCG